MEIKLSAHGAYKHQYHIVWIPKYRRPLLKADIKRSIETGIKGITTYHAEIEVIKLNVQIDHIHLVIDIPPKYSISSMVGKIKQNTSKDLWTLYPHLLKKTYPRGIFWSPGFFSSTVGLNEKQIQQYVEFQGRQDRNENQLTLC